MIGGLASFASRKPHDSSLIARHSAGSPPISASNQANAVQILIRNIDRKLTEEEVTDLFRKHGKVTSCDLVMDPKSGQSKGFGFAEMPNMDEASKAISALNGQKVGALALRVKRAANSTISKHKGNGRK
jgi:RNA recognition motif-containing protein